MQNSDMFEEQNETKGEFDFMLDFEQTKQFKNYFISGNSENVI